MIPEKINYVGGHHDKRCSYHYLYNELCKTRVLIGLEECVIRV